jgi:hypothetical protein
LPEEFLIASKPLVRFYFPRGPSQSTLDCVPRLPTRDRAPNWAAQKVGNFDGMSWHAIFTVRRALAAMNDGTEAALSMATDGIGQARVGRAGSLSGLSLPGRVRFRRLRP